LGEVGFLTLFVLGDFVNGVFVTLSHTVGLSSLRDVDHLDSGPSSCRRWYLLSSCK
jgi:hypothetical protein